MTRALLSILLSLVLVLTSHSAAVARGSNVAVDHFVICAGSVVTVVYVDADGQPTEATHLCPDYALHVLEAVSPPSVLPDLLSRPREAVAPGHGTTAWTQHLHCYQSRGPPSL